MKNLYTAIAAIMSFTVVASAEDDPRGKPIVEPAASASASATPAPAPAAAPAAAPAPAATAETLPNGQPKPADYGECIEQLATSITDGAELNKKLDDCTKKVERLEGGKKPSTPKAETPKPPRQPRKFACEGDGIQPSGLDCACDDEEAVAVVKSPGTKTCVPRYAAFLLLKKRVAALEERPDFKIAIDAISVRIDELSTLEGEHFNTLYASIQLILGDMEKVKKQLEDHERRIGAIEAHDGEQDAKDAAHDSALADHDRVLRDHKSHIDRLELRLVPRSVMRFTGVAAFDVQGDRGPDGRFGGMVGLEHGLTPSSLVAGVVEGGASYAPLHDDNTFGDSVVGTLAAGARIYTGQVRKVGVDVGVTYNTWLMTHSAGYLGMPSQFVGSNFGPHVGILWNMSPQAHGLLRCGVGFGPENHLSGSNIAKEHPAQPWCGIGAGVTFGLSDQ